jgi:hypothetical protein
MPVILADRLVDKKRIIGKMEGRGGGEAQGVADQKKSCDFPEIKIFIFTGKVKQTD